MTFYRDLVFAGPPRSFYAAGTSTPKPRPKPGIGTPPPEPGGPFQTPIGGPRPNRREAPAPPPSPTQSKRPVVPVNPSWPTAFKLPPTSGGRPVRSTAAAVPTLNRVEAGAVESRLRRRGVPAAEARCLVRGVARVRGE